MKNIDLNIFKLVSLLDILEHNAEFFTLLMGLLQLNESRLRQLNSTGNPSKEHADELIKVINTIDDQCESLKLKGSLKIITHIRLCFSKSNCGELIEQFSMLFHMIRSELGERVFLTIPEERGSWFNKQDAFGIEVLKKFPSAKEDIIESGNCYAVGLFTASIFHAMRVLEYGLKALAKDVDLKFYRQSWGTIINKIKHKIDSEIKSLSGQPKDPDRTERLQFLSQAAQEFTYFKDGWRNYVMHGEDRYDGPRALSILNHVKTFMSHLSTCLYE